MRHIRTAIATTAALLLAGCGTGMNVAGGPTLASPSVSAAPSPLISRSVAPSAGLPTGWNLEGNAAVPGAACEGEALYTYPGETRDPRARQREQLPAGFKPVKLVACGIEERRSRAEGQWTYRVTMEAVRGLDAVVAALRAEQPPVPAGDRACTADLRPDPWLLLVDAAGREVLPVIPHENMCDKPIDVGLEALHYTVVEATQLRQSFTPAQLGTDCPPQWKNEPRMMRAEMRDTPQALATGLQPVRVCVYGPGAEADVGDFVSGLALGEKQSARIAAAMLGGEPAASAGCEPAEDFAVVHLAAPEGWVYVEMSGCERLATGYSHVARVPKLVKVINDLPLQG